MPDIDALVICPGPTLSGIGDIPDAGVTVAVTGAISHDPTRLAADYWMVSDRKALDCRHGTLMQSILIPDSWPPIPSMSTTPYDIAQITASMPGKSPKSWKRWTFGKAIAWLWYHHDAETIHTLGVDWSGEEYHDDDIRDLECGNSRWERERRDIRNLLDHLGVRMRQIRE